VGDARSTAQFLAGLPFERWAVRLRTGEADIHGTLSNVDVTVGGHQVRLCAGPATLSLLFLGGRSPVLAAVDLTGTVTHDGGTGGRLRLVGGRVLVDGEVLPERPAPVASAGLVHAVLAHLSDIHVNAHARPDGDSVVRLPEGIEVRLTHDDEIAVHARASGPPSALVLAAPLKLRFGAQGIQLDHESARWLARLAGVRIRSAALHPDGRVELNGSATKGLNHVLRGGLRSASSHLSGLVRRSPRFHRVRAFLPGKR